MSKQTELKEAVARYQQVSEKVIPLSAEDFGTTTEGSLDLSAYNPRYERRVYLRHRFKIMAELGTLAETITRLRREMKAERIQNFTANLKETEKSS